MKKKLIACILVLSLFLTACVGGGGSANKQISEGEAHTKKYNAYIEMLNFSTGQWLNTQLRQYFREFGTEKEPTLEKTRLEHGFLFGPSQPGQTLFDRYSPEFATSRALADKAPDFGLADEKARALADALEALLRVFFFDMNDYYNSTDYKDDNFAKGREYHVRMVDCHDNLLKAIEEFSIALEQISLESEQKDLQMFADHNMVIHFQLLRIALTGRQMGNMFSILDMQELDYSHLDLAEFESLYDLLVADIESLTTLAADEGQMNAEGLTSMKANRMSFFIIMAKDLESATEDMIAKLQAGATTLDLRQFNRHIEQLIDYYNQIIS